MRVIFTRHSIYCAVTGGRAVRRGSAASRLLELQVRIPLGAFMSVACECCVLSGKRSLRLADPWSRGVLQSVVCLSVISKPQQLGGLGSLGAVAPWEKLYCSNKGYNILYLRLLNLFLIIIKNCTSTLDMSV